MEFPRSVAEELLDSLACTRTAGLRMGVKLVESKWLGRLHAIVMYLVNMDREVVGCVERCSARRAQA